MRDHELAALALLEHAGGSVDSDIQSVTGSIWLDEFLCVGPRRVNLQVYFNHLSENNAPNDLWALARLDVVEIMLPNDEILDNLLADPTAFPRLRVVYCHDGKLSDAALHGLLSRPDVQKLTISDTQLTGGPSRLCRPNSRCGP